MTGRNDVEARGGDRLSLVAWPSLALCVAASFLAGLHVIGQPAFDALVYDRAAICAGEIWRLLTGHLVHLGSEHVFWNLSAFVAMVWLAERVLNMTWRRVALVMGGSAVSISGALWVFEPALMKYCGLSGALSGLFVALAVRVWSKTRSPVALIAVIGLGYKICYELVSGETLFADVIWPTVPTAHAAGAMSVAVVIGAAALAGRVRRMVDAYLAFDPTPSIAWGVSVR